MARRWREESFSRSTALPRTPNVVEMTRQPVEQALSARPKTRCVSDAQADQRLTLRATRALLRLA